MITVICPVHNESKYIKSVLDFCIAANPAAKEVIFIDGNSTDNTCEIITSYMQQHNCIRLLHNPKKYVPYSLNLALKEAKGEIIIRLDAHTEYAADYFEKIVETFNATGADIVGGPMRIAKGNSMQAAIGYATSTYFGIGNSSFHFEDFEGFTDSVYLGAWRKKVFNFTGVFDEKLKRNQDDEFHYRAKRNGFTIYQNPAIKLYYHPRQTCRALFKQYYEYGFYKPAVLLKNKTAMRLRHIVPSLFVLYLLVAFVCLVFGFYIGLLPLLFYLLLDLYFSIGARKNSLPALQVAVVYPILHLAYGCGFISGLLKSAWRK